SGFRACPPRRAQRVSTVATFVSVLTGSTAPPCSAALDSFDIAQDHFLAVGVADLDPGSVVLEAEIPIAGVDREHRHSRGWVDGFARFGHGEPERLDDGATGVLTV